MPLIKLKRVYEDYSEDDGFRVLVDRLWPRGIKKEYLHYDLWAKEISPSPSLRKWFHADPEDRWREFSEMYRRELEASSTVAKFVDEIASKKTVTLLFASREPEHNHARILKAYLDDVLVKD